MSVGYAEWKFYGDLLLGGPGGENVIKDTIFDEKTCVSGSDSVYTKKFCCKTVKIRKKRGLDTIFLRIDTIHP